MNAEFITALKVLGLFLIGFYSYKLLKGFLK